MNGGIARAVPLFFYETARVMNFSALLIVREQPVFCLFIGSGLWLQPGDRLAAGFG